MLREKPPIAETVIAQILEAEYNLSEAALTFLPIGYDPYAAVYRVDASEGTYFLKLTRNAIVPANLQIPRTLIDHGVANVLAPLRTCRQQLWCTLDAYNVILYPFIHGENAMRQGMSDQQWIAFGTTLDAIHSSGLDAQFCNVVPIEDFATPMIGLVRAMLQQVQHSHFALPVQRELAAFWRQNAATIELLTDRAEELGMQLQAESFDPVLCHGDIHAANIMLEENGTLYLVDWDTTRIAPRERDLLFIVGSVVARRVTPHEEACFFRGYGARPIHWRALTYYRYERVLEDMYEGGRSVFLDEEASVALKESDARFTMGLFQAGNLVPWAIEADQKVCSYDTPLEKG